jgi:hypothetical protein
MIVGSKSTGMDAWFATRNRTPFASCFVPSTLFSHRIPSHDHFDSGCLVSQGQVYFFRRRGQPNMGAWWWARCLFVPISKAMKISSSREYPRTYLWLLNARTDSSWPLDHNGWVILRCLTFYREFNCFFFSYEFAQNEFITALDTVTLETASTETGNKQFIAVGTTINRGEDLATKGAVCFAPFPWVQLLTNL